MTDDIKRILIMEDSDIFADIIMGFLSSFDYVVERAVNGFEGIKKVYSFLPHLVITDIEMPILKGYQVTRLLKTRKNTKTIPIIMLTSLNENKDRFWANQAGADVYFDKSPDNLQPLEMLIKQIFSAPQTIDFTAIEREGKKINDNSIIEIVNNLLDNKLFQTTIIGMLNDLSGKLQSMDAIASGILDLLHTVCEAELSALLIRGSNRILYSYTTNNGNFTREIAENFINICISDFNNLLPEYKFLTRNNIDFHSSGSNNKNVLSYINIPLTIAGDDFASLHIANTINDYFSPSIMENIKVFSSAASPVIANTLSMHELSQLQNITRTAFARYVPADVMDEIIKDTNKKKSLSENRIVSVLFNDIRNFTGFAENSDAQSVVDFLNNYFAKMGNEIISENGHIDKFIGDAIMAIFGAFQNLENSPVSAIRAALKMFHVLEIINAGNNNLTNNRIDIGIGINCGECILGNIGFKNKMDYTIIGDTVNLASRIENLTKFYRYPLIVSEYVYEQAKDKFLMRKIDNVRVKGKDKSTGVYAVYSGFHGEEDNLDIPPVSFLKINRDTFNNYNKGLQVFFMREWKLACEYFGKALEADKNDYLSELYLERSKNFYNNPPPDNWDGVITLDEK